MKVGHSTLHRLVQRALFSPPDAKQAVTEVSVDGGKVRIRSNEAEGSHWLEGTGLLTRGGCSWRTAPTQQLFHLYRSVV